MPEVNGEISKKLSCSFSSDADLKTTLIINDPVDNLNSETVSAAMETMVGSNVLMDRKGNMITAAISAKLVTTMEQTLF